MLKRKRKHKKLSNREILNSILVGISIGMNIVFILFYVIILINSSNDNTTGKFYDRMQIIAEGFTEEEYSLIDKVINYTKPHYEITSKEIYFIKNWSNCSKCPQDSAKGKYLADIVGLK